MHQFVTKWHRAFKFQFLDKLICRMRNRSAKSENSVAIYHPNVVRQIWGLTVLVTIHFHCIFFFTWMTSLLCFTDETKSCGFGTSLILQDIGLYVLKKQKWISVYAIYFLSLGSVELKLSCTWWFHTFGSFLASY